MLAVEKIKRIDEAWYCKTMLGICVLSILQLILNQYVIPPFSASIPWVLGKLLDKPCYCVLSLLERVSSGRTMPLLRALFCVSGVLNILMVFWHCELAISATLLWYIHMILESTWCVKRVEQAA